MPEQREPSVVSEARNELGRLKRWTAVPVTLMILSWLPLLFIEDILGKTGMIVVIVLYVVFCMVASVAIAWKTEQASWARELVESWSRAQADSKIRGAMREHGLTPSTVDTPSAVLMGRIREHLELDARALRAAEDAYTRLNGLRLEAAASLQALTALPEGDGRDRLEGAHDTLCAEAQEIEGSLAALYATLLTRESRPTFAGLKNTMLELEAEAEVDATATERQKLAALRAKAASKTGP
jgi:hypothetical protein